MKEHNELYEKASKVLKGNEYQQLLNTLNAKKIRELERSKLEEEIKNLYSQIRWRENRIKMLCIGMSKRDIIIKRVLEKVRQL